MYSIFANDICIYNDVTPMQEYKDIKPKLTMADNSAGSLEFTLPPGNVGYDLISRLLTCIRVVQDGEEIWRGRVIMQSEDFWKQRTYTCEGELAYLNDSIQEPKEYDVNHTTITSFLTDIIAAHNAKMLDENNPTSYDDRTFQVGYVSVNDGDKQDDDDAINRYTNYETTLQCINDKLVDKLGGHIRIRHENGVRYIDYLNDYTNESTQEIVFGQNLLDYTKNFDVTNLVTVIYPRGKKLEDDRKTAGYPEGLEQYLTVDMAQGYDDKYVKNLDAVKTFGWIETTVDWSNVENADILLEKAIKYIKDLQFDDISLEVSMFDLHYLNPSITSLHLLEYVHCVSVPHGLDRNFPVTKIELDLNDPSSSVYTLGTVITGTLSDSATKKEAQLSTYLDDMRPIPSKKSILDTAKEEAFSILTGSAGGVVKFIKDEHDRITDIVILNNYTDETATYKWVFNQNGLGHFIKNQGGTWGSVNIALTKEGSIVADMITSGTLRVDGNAGSSGRIGGLNVYDGQSVIGSWNFNGISIQKGSINLGNGVFQVTNAGDLIATSATLTGSIHSSGHDSLDSTADGYFIGSNGLSIGSKFSVSKAGALEATSATLTGSIHSSGHNTYGSTADGYFIGSNGLSIGSAFKVSSSGFVGTYGTGNNAIGFKPGFFRLCEERGTSWSALEYATAKDPSGNNPWGYAGGNLELWTGGNSDAGFTVHTSSPNESPTAQLTYATVSQSNFRIVDAGTIVAVFDEERYETWNRLSDERVKDDIEDIDISTSKELISGLKPKTFRYNEKCSIKSDYIHSGFIAQEVMNIPSSTNGIVEEDSKGLYTLHYDEIIPHLVNVIKDMQMQIDELKERINNNG